MDPSHFDSIAEKLDVGEPLSDFDISELSSTPNLLRLGALADERRRCESGARVTFVRVFEVLFGAELDSQQVPDSAGETRGEHLLKFFTSPLVQSVSENVEGDAHEGTSWPDSRYLTCNVTRIFVICNLAIKRAMRRSFNLPRGPYPWVRLTRPHF